MSSPTTFLNFAYGSNMSSRRLRARTPSAASLGIGMLVGHRLAWHKLGQDGSAKCDILETGRPDDVVWGVLYEIASAEQGLLDQAEGLGNGYEYKTVAIQTATAVVSAGAYYATDTAADLQAFDWYLAFVIGGAEEHQLPEAYRLSLRSVSVLVDPNSERRFNNLSLLRGDAR